MGNFVLWVTPILAIIWLGLIIRDVWRKNRANPRRLYQTPPPEPEGPLFRVGVQEFVDLPHLTKFDKMLFEKVNWKEEGF